MTLTKNASWVMEDLTAKVENMKSLAKQHFTIIEVHMDFWYVGFHIINLEMEERKGKGMSLDT